MTATTVATGTETVTAGALVHPATGIDETEMQTPTPRAEITAIGNVRIGTPDVIVATGAGTEKEAPVVMRDAMMTIDLIAESNTMTVDEETMMASQDNQGLAAQHHPRDVSLRPI